MNPLIQELWRQAVLNNTKTPMNFQDAADEFAELLVRKCAEICLEMSAKCAGLEDDGALAKDCAYWIKKDFGVEE